MSRTSKPPVERPSEELVTQTRYAIARFINGKGNSLELTDVLKQIYSGTIVPRTADSANVRTFGVLWRSTPRPPAMTDGQWDADYRYILEKVT